MKVLLELLIIGALIFAGWKQSYREHLDRLIGRDVPPPKVNNGTPRTRAEPSPAPTATATPQDTSWMWKKGTLDPKNH